MINRILSHPVYGFLVSMSILAAPIYFALGFGLPHWPFGKYHMYSKPFPESRISPYFRVARRSPEGIPQWWLPKLSLSVATVKRPCELSASRGCAGRRIGLSPAPDLDDR